MSYDTEPQPPFLSAIEDAAEPAHRMRAYGIVSEQVVCLFASVPLALCCHSRCLIGRSRRGSMRGQHTAMRPSIFYD
jgi:hypothetical protein